MQTTRWIDRETQSLDTAIELLTDVVLDDVSEDVISWNNWHFQKASDNNFEECFNGRNITFNVVRYSYDQVTPGTIPIEDRTVRKEGFIIIYSNGVSVNYIIDRNSDAKKLLRKILSYSGRNEIDKNMYDLSSDFFTWLICKVYNSENMIESENDTLSDVRLDAIKGFKGDTEDLLTKVSADGETVMNIISTLSFLLESSKLNQVKLDLEYDEHNNVGLVLKRGVVSTDINQYRGGFEGETEKDIRIAKIYLLVYLELLPILVQAYQSDKENDIWNNQVYVEFMNRVAHDLTMRVQQKINAMNN